jgi:hypothetical protein
MILRWLRKHILRKSHRRLSVSRSGHWYLFFTIAVGVFALVLGNNVVYLIESFLLAGLILSGVISERVVSSIKFQIFHSQAIAGNVVQDWLHLENTSKMPLFSVEFGEIIDGEFSPLFYIPVLRANEKISVPGKRLFEKRGEYQWDGYGIATSYPFGFARKMRVEWSKNSRIVWIEKKIRAGSAESILQSNGIGGQKKVLPVEGEVRPYLSGEDARDLVPSKSAFGIGPMSRNRRLHSEEKEIILDLTKISIGSLEDQLKTTASSFYLDTATELILKKRNHFQKFRGQKPALAALSILTDEDCK